MSLRELFQDHIRILEQRTSAYLAELSLDALVIDAGVPFVYFEDDQELKFRSNHHFRYWCPLEGAHHLLCIKPGQKPRLLVLQAADFWYEVKPLETDFWTDSFSIEVFTQESELWKALGVTSNWAYHGSQLEKAAAAGLKIHVDGLLPRLNWSRLRKTAYELMNITEASRIAAKGHKAAERCFHQGGSELDIHFAYLNALRVREQDLPYESIICLNEKAAFLHYSAKRDEVHNGRVLLIDAGSQVLGYAADITRTYATEEAPEEFRSILNDLGSIQETICGTVKAGIRMNDLHFQTHQKIAQLLIDHRILMNCKADEALERGFTSAFFPHGLGHMLGIFVHDVAGKQIDHTGKKGESDPRFPYLRALLPLEEGMCVTIEPGLYFIKILLDPFRASEFQACFNWSLIERLMPCGGIRIEDDVFVQSHGNRNITREFLP